ncbi:hypothetical protein [Neisseria mucosa]|jgi:hypothetical protein|uniref:hypothetical protein n=1 Tax=Neisseria mucosa TaxID=488 RepID=UPI00280BC6B4|nr:hypothetical protein [Neisseria mucosa]
MTHITLKTHIPYILLASVLLAGCQNYQADQSRRSKIAQFAINHPKAAQTIGVEDKNSTNLTSNAARFAKRTGLDDRANGEGRGTQVNAVRQALWQAAISSQFDSEIADRAGNAYLSDMEIREGKTDYYSRFLADQAVDQRNNRIGRSIGSGKPGADMKTILQSVLFYYHKVGLWTASEVKASNRKVWRISQEKLSEAEYRRALANIEPLNADGMFPNEQRILKTDALEEIKKVFRAITRVED